MRRPALAGSAVALHTAAAVEPHWLHRLGPTAAPGEAVVLPSAHVWPLASPGPAVKIDWQQLELPPHCLGRGECIQHCDLLQKQQYLLQHS